jgi:hypothetical protein
VTTVTFQAAAGLTSGESGVLLSRRRTNFQGVLTYVEYALFALPIQSGKTAPARSFLQELEDARKNDYAASEKRLGITKEVWAIQNTPMGELFVVFFQAPDIAGAVGQFVGSRDPFDQWFKEQVKDTTGVDLNVPPPGALSEILSVYDAGGAVAV